MQGRILQRDYVKITEKYIKWLKFLGLDLLDGSYKPFPERYARSIFIAMFPGLAIFVVVFVNRGGSDPLVDRVKDLLTAIVMIQDLITFFIFTTKRKHYRNIYLDMAKIWPSEEISVKKLKIKKLWVRRISLFDHAYMWMFYFATPIFFAAPIILNLYKYFNYTEFDFFCPIDSCKPWKTNNIFVYFVVSAFLEPTMVSVFHFVLQISFRMMIMAFTCQICMMLNFVQEDFENVINKSGTPRIRDGSSVDEQGQRHYKKIVDILERHQQLLKLSKNVSDISGSAIFVCLGGSSLFMCMSLFYTVICGLLQIIAWLVAVTEGLLICWPGQFLLDVSTLTADKAYASLWYETDPRTAKLFIIIIMRSQKPAKLHPLGFCILGFTLFTSMLSLSWSFFSILYHIDVEA